MSGIRAFLPLAVLALTGCASLPPGACDPSNSEVSLIHKMRCDTGGGYREVINQKEAGLIAAKEENELFKASLEALEAQRASFGKSVREQQQARDKVVASTRVLLNQVRAKGANNQRLKTQLSLAENDLEALQSQPIEANAGTADLAERQRQVQDLERTVERLRDSVLLGM